ncbi:integrase [Azospirillum picis]|uniref:Integrase n=2 Tax=Azospirillum picis TaxID=488438 RepID=A0ABU0MWA3_9PROT|nr:integrase [Azospirillum picis]MDQ0537468.1 integrase [Azospirillum picis]
MFGEARFSVATASARTVCDGSSSTKSMGVGSPCAPVQAMTAAPNTTAIMIDLDALADRIVGRLGGNGSAAVPSPTSPQQAPPLSKTIREVYDAFMADPGVIRSGKTVLAYETVFSLLIEIIGEETAVASINREVCRDVLETLRRLPVNARKRYPGITARQIADKTAGDTKLARLSTTTVNGYMDKLSALLTWAVNEGYIDKNPAKGLGVVEATHKKDKRNPFAINQLQKIFSAPLYTGCKDDEYGYAEVGDARPRRGRFWVPLIGLFSGMRLNEICQLNTEDVRTIDGVDCFVITAETIKGAADKRLKTASSERVVPVHPELINLGFMEYVREQRRKKNTKLFPDLGVAKTGYYSDTFSKWFRRFLQKSGAAAGRTCFHSLRHNFRDALREARVDREIALALGGWAGDSSDMGTESAEFYGRGFRATTLLEAIRKVQYPNLNLSALHIAT